MYTNVAYVGTRYRTHAILAYPRGHIRSVEPVRADGTVLGVIEAWPRLVDGHEGHVRGEDRQVSAYILTYLYTYILKYLKCYLKVHTRYSVLIRRTQYA